MTEHDCILIDIFLCLVQQTVATVFDSDQRIGQHGRSNTLKQAQAGQIGVCATA